MCVCMCVRACARMCVCVCVRVSVCVMLHNIIQSSTIQFSNISKVRNLTPCLKFAGSTWVREAQTEEKNWLSD